MFLKIKPFKWTDWLIHSPNTQRESQRLMEKRPRQQHLDWVRNDVSVEWIQKSQEIKKLTEKLNGSV